MNSKIRVLVVDDSAFARVAISKSLSAFSDMDVVGVAKDGLDALEQTKSLNPDVVTLDVTMPTLDGLEALQRIMKECPTPVVMLSALTDEGTHATIEALEMGAIDFFLKPSVVGPTGVPDETESLVSKVRTAARARVSNRKNGAVTRTRQVVVAPQKRPGPIDTKVLVIGSSTGGPKALAELLPRLPQDLPASIAVVQHMPAGFTRSLADRLNLNSNISVKEAENGDRLEAGKALIVPGSYHMVVATSGRISLNQGPMVCGVRPSVDVTLESVAKAFESSARVVILTGMGSDGANGARLVKQAGGMVVVEHESTCVVYGMPKSVIDAGYADAVVPIHKMAEHIVSMCYEQETALC